MSASLLARIEEEYPHLSKGHKKLADYILENYDKAAFFTAAKLGEVTGISVSTVVRFATHMGYEGYPEFHAALQEAIKGKLTATQRLEVGDTQLAGVSILDTVLQTDIDSIKRTLQTIDRDAFAGAADAINGAKHIYILGVRSSGPIASLIHYYFKMVYPEVILIRSTSSSEMFEELFRIGPDDVCIAVSFPRYSKQVYNMLSYVRDRKARIIALTDHPDAPIASISDFVLIARTSMLSFLDSITAPISIVNALILAASGGRHDDVVTNLSELERVWDLYDIYENPDEDEPVREESPDE